MKRKIGTVIEEDIFQKAKERAAKEGRALSDLFQEALIAYLHGNVSHGDAERACKFFCSHRSQLNLEEIDALLQEDQLAG